MKVQVTKDQVLEIPFKGISQENVEKMAAFYLTHYISRDVFKFPEIEKIPEAQKRLADINAYIAAKGLKGTGVKVEKDPLKKEIRAEVLRIMQNKKNLPKLQKQFDFTKFVDFAKTDECKKLIAEYSKNEKIIAKAKAILAAKNEEIEL